MNQKYDPNDMSKENCDHPVRYQDLDPETKKSLDEWIQRKFELSPRMDYHGTSQGWKHIYSADSGIYIYNGAFKGAMLAAGYTPANPKDRSWYFNSKDRMPDSFYGWAFKRYRYMDSPLGDFVRKMERDYHFPIYSTDKEEIRSYIDTGTGDCWALGAFEKIWKCYEHG